MSDELENPLESWEELAREAVAEFEDARRYASSYFTDDKWGYDKTSRRFAETIKCLASLRARPQEPGDLISRETLLQQLRKEIFIIDRELDVRRDHAAKGTPLDRVVTSEELQGLILGLNQAIRSIIIAPSRAPEQKLYDLPDGFKYDEQRLVAEMVKDSAPSRAEPETETPKEICVACGLPVAVGDLHNECSDPDEKNFEVGDQVTFVHLPDALKTIHFTVRVVKGRAVQLDALFDMDEWYDFDEIEIASGRAEGTQ